MKAVSMVAVNAKASRPLILAYEATEEALALLSHAGYPAIAPVRRLVSEAAYYMSDTIDPDERVDLAAAATEQAGRPRAEPAADALALLEDIAAEVERLLRGPDASSELRIGMRALRSALAELGRELGSQASGREGGLRGGRPGALTGG